LDPGVFKKLPLDEKESLWSDAVLRAWESGHKTSGIWMDGKGSCKATMKTYKAEYERVLKEREEREMNEELSSLQDPFISQQEKIVFED